MVVVRVVVSVTEVLRCLCFRGGSAVVVSVGAVSVGVVVLGWLIWTEEVLSCLEAALKRLRMKILRNRIKNCRKGFIYFTKKF